ncbi:hypothetical protein RQP54_02060 [Curvibacter sp. APW13]|uniref:substrate-binding periplasmic protein n=1 Tax=Curvibacter sp. APW13 TaxID=3077236 RepID=UPI0028DEBF7B|nr:hypothetical protein [Curvibacter sp. APW13]MDT8989642.1 hypothetical protein [Curvibacter sp. APW13]
MRVLHSVRWWWLLLISLPCGMAWAQTPVSGAVTVRLMSQYDYPPFQTGAEEGLTFELAEYLTRHANGQYRFVAEVLPRKRLDLYLADPAALWVVPWAVPRFFGPDATSTYAWSPPYMADGNHLLTRKGSAIRYTGPESLAGLRFGATLGHRYGLLDPLVQAGRLMREDCYNLLCNVEKLKRDRVDFAWVPSGSIGYLRKQVSDFDTSIEVSVRPVESFERSFMLPKGQPALQRYLEGMVRKLASDPAWKDALNPAGMGR